MIKINQPVPSGEYKRDRLFKRLDDLLMKKVVWVSAPAGSGKTTLMGSYIAERKIPCLWYQLDEGDSDLATFFYYMGEAAKKAASRRKKAMPLFTPEYAMGVGIFTLRYFEELCDRLPKPSLIVFDNHQDVPHDSFLNEVMLNAFSILPEGVHAVVISRSEPHPVLIRLKASGMMDGLGWDEIRLMEEESEEIVRMRMSGDTGVVPSRELHSLAGGWVTGLILMAEDLRNKGLLPKEAGEFMREEIFFYFAQEVFKRLDINVRTFMLKTAYLPKITADMAESLTGVADSGKILSDICRRNGFIAERFEPGPSYEFHPLYREFLIKKAGTDLSYSEQIAVRRSAAALLELSGESGSAVALLREINDWEGMARIIMTHAQEMLAQGRFAPLQKWLDNLPAEYVSVRPWLLYWQGMCLLTFFPLDAKPLFEKAYGLFRSSDDVMGALLSASAVMNALFIGMDDYEPLDRWFTVVDDLCRGGDFFPNPEIEAWVLSGLMAALGLREIVHPSADDWAERVYGIAENPATLVPKANALHQLFWFGAMRKGIPAVERAWTELRRMALSKNAHPMVALTAKRVENSYYQLSGMAGKCIESAREGLDIAKRHGILFFDFVFMVTQITSLLDIMEINAATVILDSLLLSPASRSRHGRAAYLMYRSRAMLISCEPEKALALAEEMYPLVKTLNSPFGIGMCLLRKAQALHDLGRRDEARRDLADVFDISETHASQWLRLFAHYHDASFAFDGGDEEQGKTALSHAFKLARSCGYVFCTDDVPGITSRLCLKALLAGIETGHVRTVIRRRGLTPPTGPGVNAMTLEVWPYPVTIMTLGRFEIIREDTPLVFSGKVQKKPLELLKVIIAMGGGHVPVERLTDALWPDTEGDLAHKSFEMTLSRLRKLLGCDDIITCSAGQVGIDSRRCRVDSLVLESLLEYMDTAPDDEAAALCAQTIRLYNGVFLPSETGLPWSSHRRDLLHNGVLRNLMRAGRYHESVGAWDKALEFYKRGIETDNLAESFYQRVMVCQNELGHRADAVKTYQTCCRLLQIHLGLSPSQSTEVLYASIIR